MATRTALLSRAGSLRSSPALIDGLLAYAVAMAVGVAVFASSIDSQPGPWPAYVFAVGFGLILLVRRRRPVLVLIITSLGICVYYTLQYPPIGLALPIAAALFSAAEAGHLRISIVVSVILVGLAVYFQITEGRDVAQLLGYELPPVIALMGASLALGDGVRSRRLLRKSQREQDRQARLELERRANEQRDEERLRLARDLHDALGHSVAMISLESAVAAEALPDRVPEARRAVAEIRSISLAAMRDCVPLCGAFARWILLWSCQVVSTTFRCLPRRLAATALRCGSSRAVMVTRCPTRLAGRHTGLFRRR